VKYLVWLLLGVLAWWAYRRSRAQRSGGAKTPPAPADSATPPAPQDMVACRHCGLHLPHSEAVAGALGPYCSAAHRSAAGDRNPD